MEYSYHYKKELPIESSWEDLVNCDIFISAFNLSQRVKIIYDKINIKNKYWLIFPEYQYEEDELPEEEKFICSNGQEGEQIISFFNYINKNLSELSITIDITGFMRPQLAFLLKYLHMSEVKKLDLIYSEPERYFKKEDTSFSDGNVIEIRQIAGFEGVHSRDTSNDLLIIGSGYDHSLIKSVCSHKEHAKIKQLLGFPSLRPDMYQENIIKAAMASDSIEPESLNKPLFAPANNPFITAEVLSDTVKYLNKNNMPGDIDGFSNLYLCPLSTKPHTVGFVLFFLKELKDKPVSIIYPFFEKYDKETSIGVNKVWMYSVEFD